MGARRGGQAKKLGPVAVALAACLAVFVSAGTAQAAMPKLWKAGENCGDVQKLAENKCGSDVGETYSPRGVAADPASGHLYVADTRNRRIDEFTAWGGFVKAWGWGVRDGKAELQSCGPEAVPPSASCLRGLKGAGTGQLEEAVQIAVGSEGNVYVGDASASRVQEFDAEGNFLLAFGRDVVASGPDDSANYEEQEITVAASGGSFKLSFQNPYGKFETAQTASLPYNASAEEVQAALNGLATIGGLGGSVTVSGGPGDATGSNPYFVKFEGAFAGDDVPQLTIDRSALGAATIGAHLICQAASPREAPTIAYQWLRNGAPIAGATTNRYTTTAADEGTAIQCQASSFTATSGSSQASNPAYVAPPAPATAPPAFGGNGLSKPTGNELKIDCNSTASSWSGEPSFSYQWYRDGLAIAGATAASYPTSTSDRSAPHNFQCAATGANAGGASTVFSEVRPLRSQDAPSPPVDHLGPRVSLEPVLTLAQGGGAEVCRVSAGDVCKRGVRGSGAGEFSANWIGLTSNLATGPAGQVYFGDAERIQRFDAEGAYQGEIALPEPGVVGALAVRPDSGNLLFAYASAEPASGSYGYTGQPDVHELDPTSGAELRKLEVGNPTAIAADEQGNAYVFDPAFTGQGDAEQGKHHARIFRFDASGALAEIAAENQEVTGTTLETAYPTREKEEFSKNGVALAANPVTEAGAADLYVASFGELRTGVTTSEDYSFISAYGPPPEKWPPPLAPPSIDDQYAISVGAKDATLGAAINPHFWKTTSYQVEYGTGPCAEGGCEALTPSSRLGSRVTDEDVAAPGIFVGGLQPATTYHYRVRATTDFGEGEGAEVVGRGGTVGGTGTEGTFRTFALPAPRTDCPNQAFRTGPSANLPDCRAYEMVSPLDKVGGDIDVSTPTSQLNQAAAAGNGFTYSSNTAFAEPKSAPFTSQYLAERDPERGWRSKSISTPQEGPILLEGVEYAQITSFFKAFSPDLSTGWALTLKEPVLAPGGVPGQPNFYRRENGADSYGACTAAPPLEAEPRQWLPEFMGAAADQRHALFTSGNELTPEAGGKIYYQLYECSFGEGEAATVRLISILPSGVAHPASSWAGSPPEGNYLPGFGLSFENNSMEQAISADGSRVFWTASPASNDGDEGTIYLRENAPAPESAHQFGTATGTGNLIGPVECAGTPIGGTTSVGGIECKGSPPKAGQEITDSAGAIPVSPPTTIVKVEEPKAQVYKFTLSAKATKTAPEDKLLALGSRTVSALATESGAFQVSQEVSGEGLPTGATITALGAGTLTLSARATASGEGVALGASSRCTEAAGACTYRVSPSTAQTRYWGATPSGSKALVETLVSKENKAANALYLFETAKAIAGEDPRTKIAGEAQGVLGASEDLSRIYFVSREEIEGEGEEGAPNLYLWEAGTVSLLATLAAGEGSADAKFSPTSQVPTTHLARVSPDGGTLVFMSASPALAAGAGYDNTDLIGHKADMEIYRYERASESLACISCNPSGARPAVGLGFDMGVLGRLAATSLLKPWPNTLYPARPVSADGRRVFFESLEALNLADTNGRIDVYQWEQEGTGDCEAGIPTYVEASGGCLALVSSGKSANDTRFFDAGEDGSDVFLKTTQGLLPQDPGSADVYDARVEGGFAPVSQPAAACEGEACQGTPEAPEDPTPASESFEGAGNVHEEAVTQRPKPKPCGKGKVRRHGKCVKKHKRHAKKHRKRSHKKHRAQAKRRAGR